MTRRLSPARPKPCLRRTGFAARVLVAFATAIRLPAPLHPPSLSFLLTEWSAGGLDPLAPWLEAVEDQTPLVDFCNTNNPRAPPANRPIPTSPSIPSTRLRALLAPRAFAREDRSLHPTPGLRPEP